MRDVNLRIREAATRSFGEILCCSVTNELIITAVDENTQTVAVCSCVS